MLASMDGTVLTEEDCFFTLAGIEKYRLDITGVSEALTFESRMSIVVIIMVHVLYTLAAVTLPLKTGFGVQFELELRSRHGRISVAAEGLEGT